MLLTSLASESLPGGVEPVNAPTSLRTATEPSGRRCKAHREQEVSIRDTATSIDADSRDADSRMCSHETRVQKDIVDPGVSIPRLSLPGVSTTKLPGLVAPSQCVVDTFDKTDLTSPTCVIKSIGSLQARVQTCHSRLCNPHLSAIDKIRTECDRDYASRLARELESKLSIMFAQDFGPLAHTIHLALNHINAVTKAAKSKTKTAYLLAAVPFFKRLVSPLKALALTNELLVSLKLWKRVEEGEKGALARYSDKTDVFLKNLRKLTISECGRQNG